MSRTLSTLKLGTAMAGIALAASVALVLAGHDAPTSQDAWAPGPATTTEEVSGPNGATGAAVYVTTQQPTTVVRWYSTPTAFGSAPLAAGMPCTTGAMAAGSTTYKVIRVGQGSSRGWCA